MKLSEERLRSIVEAEPECVKVLGKDGKLLEMNPAGLAMIEADSIEQVRGKPVASLVVPEHRAAFEALTERVFGASRGRWSSGSWALKARAAGWRRTPSPTATSGARSSGSSG